MSARDNATTSNVFDENDRLKHDVNAYFGRAQDQANTSIGHDQLVLRAPDGSRFPRLPDLSDLDTYIDSSNRSVAAVLAAANDKAAHLQRELDITVNGTPKNGPDTPLFDNEDNYVTFSYLEPGSYLLGTEYNALGGDDIVSMPADEAKAQQLGYDWNNIFYGGDGNDQLVDGIHQENGQIWGGLDNKFDGGNGNDFLSAGLGDDIIWGGNGDDLIHAGAGNFDDDPDTQKMLDKISDNDLAFGGDGNDVVCGWSGNDILIGDAGNDIIFGWNNNDILVGGEGSDILVGGDNSDQLYGGEGNDKLFDVDMNLTHLNEGSGIPDPENDGQDILYGGDGSDSLFVSAYDDGRDLLIGGGGNDMFTLFIDKAHAMPSEEWDVIVDFQNGYDTIKLLNNDVLGDQDGIYFDSFDDLKIVDVNGDSYIFGKDANVPIVIVQNAAGLLDAGDFTFQSFEPWTV